MKKRTRSKIKKRNWLLSISVLVLLALLAYFVINFFDIRLSSPSAENELGLDGIKLPPGFGIQVFADLGGNAISIPGPNPGPRMMEFIDGVLFVSIPSRGIVVALPDANGDHKADSIINFSTGLNNPHGLAYYNGYIYVAEEDKVVRFVDADKNLVADSNPEVIVDGLPSGSGHFTRTIAISGGNLFISIGSSCNVCRESDARRASLMRCDIDGSNCSVYAKGLRNSVGLTFHPVTGELWATENGRDLLGEDIPPDEINIIHPGNYGWPLCYGNRTHDTDFDKNVYIRDPCADTVPPVVSLQAHSAPLGLAFYNGTMFPEEYRNNLFVAYHGSWNRNEPTGYKIVRITFDDFNGSNPVVQDFATGWLQPDGTVTGRPVDIAVAPDGSLFVSDDNTGRIYRIFYYG